METSDSSGTAGASEREILSIERPSGKLLALYFLQSCAGLIFMPLIFVPLYFKYHTLRYRFDVEGISASWGILFRREIHLTYRRIQDIHVKRNLIERWLGIATVEVQTASGKADAELSIEGMERFELLRDFLYRRMRGHEMDGAGTPATAPAEAGAPGSSGTPDEKAAIGQAEVIALLRGIQAELEGARKALEERA
jgi:putative membrane protein